ncbi:hypothetical protein FJZ55_00760 [Candidatus Woesearchaeota archaeon]|jgi:hypothetical protein|nr:hypothetical protein [Candidatus Woesearchaeota archaeon]
MQNETPKTIGRRPVYAVGKPSAERYLLSAMENRELSIEKTLPVSPLQSRHTITVLGRLSSCLSDK